MEERLGKCAEVGARAEAGHWQGSRADGQVMLRKPVHGECVRESQSDKLPRRRRCTWIR